MAKGIVLAQHCFWVQLQCQADQGCSGGLSGAAVKRGIAVGGAECIIGTVGQRDGLGMEQRWDNMMLSPPWLSLFVE